MINFLQLKCLYVYFIILIPLHRLALTCMCICARTHTRARALTNTHTHTCTNTHTNTHTHTNTRSILFAWQRYSRVTILLTKAPAITVKILNFISVFCLFTLSLIKNFAEYGFACSELQQAYD